MTGYLQREARSLRQAKQH